MKVQGAQGKVLGSSSCSGCEEELWQCPGTASLGQREIKEKTTPGAAPAAAGRAGGGKGRAAPGGTQGNSGSSTEKEQRQVLRKCS